MPNVAWVVIPVEIVPWNSSVFVDSLINLPIVGSLILVAACKSARIYKTLPIILGRVSNIVSNFTFSIIICWNNILLVTGAIAEVVEADVLCLIWNALANTAIKLQTLLVRIWALL